MSSVTDQAGLSGGYVVNTNGGFEMIPELNACYKLSGIIVGIFIVLLVLWFFITSAISTMFPGTFSGFDKGLQMSNSGPQLRFFGEPSDNMKVTGFTDAGSRSKDLWSSREAFSGSRETPYFTNATNRVLRTENREKEAVRALGKINQERLRRGGGKGSEPLPWGPFWDEWKQTHPLEGEDMTEGFQGERDLLPNY